MCLPGPGAKEGYPVEVVIARWQIRIAHRPAGPAQRPPRLPRAVRVHEAAQRQRALAEEREAAFARLLLHE